MTTDAARDTGLAALTVVSSRRSMLRPLLLFAVPLLVIGGGAFAWLQGGRYATTENAFVRADIAQVASEIAGRIVEVAVRDHQPVKAGELLVRIDPQPYRLALAKANAELDSARAAVEQAKAGLAEARADYKEAESRLKYLDVQATRQKNLAGRGVSPTTRLEQAESEAVQARDRLGMLQERIRRVEASLGGDPTRPTDAYAIVREKLAGRDRAALDLANTEITAPSNGVIVNFRLQPGEQIKPQTPLFSLVADRRPWVEANFKETDLTNVAVGQKARIALDIYPDQTWDAVVESISPATGAEFAILPPQNASGNWVKVVQRLPVRLRLIARPGEPQLRAGMTASVSIDTERHRSLSALMGRNTAVSTSRP